MTQIAVYDNSDGTGATVVVSGSLGASNNVQCQSSQQNAFVDSGVQLVGDGQVSVPLDTTLAFNVQVFSRGASDSYSNVVLVCPTKGPYSEQNNVIVGVQKQVIALGLTGIAANGMAVYRAEDVLQVAGLTMRWPGILLQKALEPERRKTLDNIKTNWSWPVILTIMDRVGSPTSLEDIHDYWRSTIINSFDRNPLAYYPKCKRVDVEPDVIQGTTTMTGGRPDSATDQGYEVWYSQLKLWCETDLLIERYRQVTWCTVASGGSGYAVGDTITLAGGPGTPAVLQVVQVNNGAVAITVVTNGGFYFASSLPTTPLGQASTSGGGSGATFNVQWSQ